MKIDETMTPEKAADLTLAVAKEAIKTTGPAAKAAFMQAMKSTENVGAAVTGIAMALADSTARAAHVGYGATPLTPEQKLSGFEELLKVQQSYALAAFKEMQKDVETMKKPTAIIMPIKR